MTKCIAKGVGQQLSVKSSSLQQFNNTKGFYQEPLLKAGYKEELKYKPRAEGSTR